MSSRGKSLSAEPLSAYVRRMNGHPEGGWDFIVSQIERLERIEAAASRLFTETLLDDSLSYTQTMEALRVALERTNV